MIVTYPEDNTALDAAVRALEKDGLVVIPTDTVYGIGADAFSHTAVDRLLHAKGRGRAMPPPVLVGDTTVVDALAVDIPDAARALMDAFWPGALTIILTAQPSLAWDLGDTNGTVALRMPDDAVARELLDATGPLAVSSANRTGVATGPTAADAREQLADSVAVYLEDGQRPAAGGVPTPSTIVDYTTEPPLIRRLGALSLETLREVDPSIVGEGN